MHDKLASLVDKSILQMTPTRRHEPPRFRMLTTLQAYALERLAANQELNEVRRRHALYYLSLAQQAENALKGPDQLAWLHGLETEHDNLRVALKWAIATPAESSLALDLAGTLGLFWEMRGHWTEGYRWLKNALAGANEAAALRRAKALLAAGALLFDRWRFNQAAPLLRQSLEMYRALDNGNGIANALYWLGRLRFRQKAYLEAASTIEQSLALYRELDDEYGISLALRVLGDCTRLLGAYERAGGVYEEGLALARKSGNQHGIAYTVNSLGELARLQGEFERAKTLYEESLLLGRQLGNEFSQAIALHNLGQATLGLGEPGRAAALFTESLNRYRKLDYARGAALCLAGLAGAASALRQPEQAARLLGAAQAHLAASNAPLPLGPADQAAYDRHLAAIKARLDPEEFSKAWKTGQQMSLAQAIASAHTFASGNIP